MNVALVCIAKNEDHYIDEWIQYHIKLGFSKIVIYQNNWRYKGKYINQDFIQLFEFDGELKQLDAYNNFIQTYYKKFDWAGFLDVDEFVVLKNHISISAFLADYNDYSSVGLNWNMFGSNGLEFNGDYSLVKRFTKCRKELDKNIKCFINFNKTRNLLWFCRHPHNIVNPNRTISVDKSHFINRGSDLNNENNRDIAYINHYYVKTKSEWGQKMARGWPISWDLPPNYKEEYWQERNTPDYNEYEDLTAYNFMYGSKMKVALVCIAKNEDHYIDEWIQYHIKLGFSKIFIYQNNWRYKGKYIDQNFIQLIELDGEYKQLDAYNNFIQIYYKKFDWAGFLDVDEFVVLKNHTNISNFLEEYNDYYSVGLNWNMFGSNGLEFNGDYSLIKRFTKCRKQLIREIKTFINFNKARYLVQFESPHNIINPNRTISVDKSHFINTFCDNNNENNRDIAYINHYYVKTKSEWEQKMARGWPLQMLLPKNYKKEYWQERNTPEYNEYEDLTAYNFMYGKK